jgi:hypothetical protein
VTGAKRTIGRPAAPLPLPLPLSAAIGLLGSASVVLGAAHRGSPFGVAAPGTWFFGSPSTTPGGGGRFLGILLVYVGIALLLGSWYELVRTVRARPGTPVRPVAAVLCAWAAPILAAPPLFSRDVYSYAAQGEMVTRGINPYIHGPTALGGGPFLRLVDPLWAHSPAPYGPAWERLAGWIVQLSGGDVRTALVGFRLVALAGVALLACAVPALASSVGSDRATAFAFAVANPLVLLDLLGGSHNDALMLGLLMAACAAARRRHVAAGLLLCALAAEVKIPALVGAAFIGWWWAGAGADRRRRLARVGAALGAVAAAMAVVATVSGLGWRWIDDLTNPGRVVSWLDPATAVGLLLAHGASALGASGHDTGFVHVARTLALAGATVISVRLLVRSDRLGPSTALGASLLAFVILGPVIWPWYETWGFVFLAVAADGWVVPVVFVLSAVACVADVPRPGLLVTGNPILVTLSWAGLAGLVGVFLGTRVQRARPPAVSEGQAPPSTSITWPLT